MSQNQIYFLSLYFFDKRNINQISKVCIGECADQDVFSLKSLVSTYPYDKYDDYTEDSREAELDNVHHQVGPPVHPEAYPRHTQLGPHLCLKHKENQIILKIFQGHYWNSSGKSLSILSWFMCYQ